MLSRICACVVGTLLAVTVACAPTSPPFLPPQGSLIEQEINPGSKGPKPTDARGSVITSFDLGQTLTPADFQVVEAADFQAQQARSGFRLSDIQKAVVRIAIPGVAPAQAELKREEIAKGWVFVFRNLPVGNATVSLQIFGADNQILFEQEQGVQIEANLTTPVNFLLDLDSPQGGCSGSNCTGNIQVTVRARTQCLGIPRFPGVGKVEESLLFGLDSLQGSVEKFRVDFGDGSPVQEISAFPVRHSYARSGRYKVSVVLDGAACKSPFEIGAYVSVE